MKDRLLHLPTRTGRPTAELAMSPIMGSLGLTNAGPTM